MDGPGRVLAVGTRDHLSRSYHAGLVERRTFLFTPFFNSLAFSAAERKPNLVLVLATRWRAQATPWAGDADVAAPNLAQFARESVVFPRAYSCCPRSAPARAALLTGRYPHSTGVIRDDAVLSRDEVTLGDVLQSAGHRTGSVVGDAAVEFMEKNRDASFFLQASLLPPPKYARRYDPARLHIRENVPPEAEQRTRHALAEYYSLCSALDEQLGRLIAAMARLGLARDTIVAFTSDRGAQFGSHDLDGDDVPFEESVRIPVAIRYPRVLQPSVSDLLISQVDLVPTLLGLCGEPAPESVQGRDLSPLLNGRNRERPESIYAEGKMGQKDEWRMVVRGSDKIVINLAGEVKQLYNLADDPYELTNLAQEPAEQLKRDSLVALARAWMRKLRDRIDPSGLKRR